MPMPNDALRTNDPVLLVPYMWIGDFVRCHSVVKILRAQNPGRPVDILSTSLCAPLADYMPGVRKAIVADLPRGSIAPGKQRQLAARLRDERYGQALVMPRTWKSALAPWLAGIPVRTGFAGEMRFGILNDIRWGERGLPRMIDRCGALALPKGTTPPEQWPTPEIAVPMAEAEAWRRRMQLDETRAVVLAPGSVGPAKRWTLSGYAGLARELTAKGLAVWVVGGPNENALAEDIVSGAGPLARNLTGNDLRNAALALRLASAAVSNDSGLMHVAAAMSVPTVGIFGPTDPWLWGPLNPLAATVQTRTKVECQPCHSPVCRMVHHRCMTEIPASQVFEAVEAALSAAR